MEAGGTQIHGSGFRLAHHLLQAYRSGSFIDSGQETEREGLEETLLLPFFGRHGEGNLNWNSTNSILGLETALSPFGTY